MRVAAVRAFAHDRRVIGDHAGVGEVLHDPRLHIDFGREASVADLVGDELPSDTVGGIGVRGGLLVQRPLLVAPSRLELLDEIAGRDDFDAETADEFERAAVDAGDVRVAVLRAVFHGDALRAIDERFDPLLELLPAQVDGRVFAGQVLERGRFDAVAELLRFPGRRDEVGPAPRAVRLGRPRDARGEDVDLAEIVEEPTVSALLANRGLNCGDRRCSSTSSGSS